MVILEKIYLQNFAIYQDEVFEFHKGFNCIVGETGAGKSLIIKAIKFLLIQFSGADVIRSQSQKLSIKIELFHDNKVHLYERIYYVQDDKHTHSIDDHIVSAAVFKKKLSGLFDITEQNTKARFFSRNDLLLLVDSFIDNKYNQNYYSYYEEYRKAKNQLDNITNKYEQSKLMYIGLTSQIKKIEPLMVYLEQEDDLELQKKNLLDLHKKKEIIEKISTLIEQSQITSHLEKMIQLQVKNTKYFDDLDHAQLVNIKNHWKEYENSVMDKYKDVCNIQNIDDLMSSLHKVQNLKLEFGKSSSEIIQYYNSLKTQFIEAENLSQLKDEAFNYYIKIEKKLLISGRELHLARLDKIKDVTEKIDNILHKLNMPNAHCDFRLDLQEENPTADGLSRPELFAQINSGEGYKDINSYASGGEKSRFLLAQRMILLETMPKVVSMFDEIDSGISGETAIAFGDVLLDLSLTTQLLVITHLPQVAIKAQKLWYVKKNTLDARTQVCALHIKDNFSKLKMDELFPLM